MERTPFRALAAGAMAAVVALSGCGAQGGNGGEGPDGSSPAEGAGAGDGDSGGGTPEALDFTAPTVDGGEIDGADLHGKPVVLWFWAPWCTICRGEAPSVMDAAERYDGEVEFIGVAGNGATDEMKEFVDSTDTGGMRHIIDEDGSIWSGFEVTIQPSFSFLRESGTFLTYSGKISEEDLDQRISEEVLG
ncbi:redoxin domain-containing protein [Nocardiopsis halophila]|uniref:redoxin domain-containing protein n=1 Tax=Nocardiopsis halophila TaxID=141692 RepID=UPI0003496B5A|nr:redoxin domain-containing protein [Nocardiopsis halophila]